MKDGLSFVVLVIGLKIQDDFVSFVLVILAIVE